MFRQIAPLLALLPAAAALAGAPVASGRPASGPVSLEEARRMLRMMDDIYRAGVLATHRMYVQEPGVPSAVTWAKQVIDEVAAKGWPKARVVAATERPLNPENAPADRFERDAVSALRGGRRAFERLEGAHLRYAAEIRVTDRSCLNCHVRNREGELLGALVYRVPVRPPKASPR